MNIYVRWYVMKLRDFGKETAMFLRYIESKGEIKKAIKGQVE